MKVRKTKLTRLTPLAEGGFGKVYRVDGFTLPGDQAPLAYKEFTADHDAQGRSLPPGPMLSPAMQTAFVAASCST